MLKGNTDITCCNSRYMGKLLRCRWETNNLHL